MKLIKIRQDIPRASIADVAAATAMQLEPLLPRIRACSRIAIAVGSRGIASLAAVVRQTVATVRQQGVEPFIVPAMGSHGGAIAEGQAAILAEYGITEELVGAPVCSSMETKELPSGECPARLHARGRKSAPITIDNRYTFAYITSMAPKGNWGSNSERGHRTKVGGEQSTGTTLKAIRLPNETLEKIKAKRRGSFSAYIRELIDRDLRKD